jgi:hypothetical protein
MTNETDWKRGLSSRQGNATDGRVYGGDAGLVHIEDGKRAELGYTMAVHLEQLIRRNAVEAGLRTQEQVDAQDLCPGCYMVAGFNMLVKLAKHNGQSMRELAASMANAFASLDDAGSNIEHINVVLDGPECAEDDVCNS